MTRGVRFSSAPVHRLVCDRIGLLKSNGGNAAAVLAAIAAFEAKEANS